MSHTNQQTPAVESRQVCGERSQVGGQGDLEKEKAVPNPFCLTM